MENLTNEERAGILQAIDWALDDQQNWFNNGGGPVDYGDEWPEVAAGKVEKLKGMASFARKLGALQMAEDCEALASEFMSVQGEDMDEPPHDDTVYYCPNCERPNQFGELCWGCQQDAEEEGLRWHDEREAAGPIG